MFCSPKYDKNGNVSCYNKDTLIKIAKAYNKYYINNNKNSNKNKKINYSNKTKEQLYNQIKKRLVGVCGNDESCWLDQKFIKNSKNKIITGIINDKNNKNKNKEDLKKEFFRTKMPKEWEKNKHTWLTNFDIYNVMTQYEDKYNDFVFLGPVPSDCPMEITCELSNLNIKRMLKEGKTRIGIIFNLDVSSGPGTHWISMFIDLKKCAIYYYDSYGIPPINRIQKFIDYFIKKCKKDLKKDFNFMYNKKRHQYGNSECGIYSMYIIDELLQDKTFKQAINRKIPDSKMNELRFKKYFRM